MRDERPRLSRHAPVAKAMDCMLKCWGTFAYFIEDDRIRLTIRQWNWWPIADKLAA